MSPYCFPGMNANDRMLFNIGPYPETKFKQKRKRIIKAVREATGFSLAEIRMKSNRPPLPWIRAIIAQELYIPEFISFPKLGKYLHKDHSTIFYYVKTLAPSLEKNKEFSRLRNNIKRYL